MSEITFIRPQKSMYKTIYEWRSDPYAVKYNPFAPCDFLDFSKKLKSYGNDFSKLYSAGTLKWACIKNDNLVGITGLSNINSMMKTAEIGYQVAPEFRQQGIGSEIVKELVLSVFSNTDVRKLCAIVASGNKASQRILEKNGFHLEGVLKEHFLINEIPTDQFFYGIINKI